MAFILQTHKTTFIPVYKLIIHDRVIQRTADKADISEKICDFLKASFVSTWEDYIRGVKLVILGKNFCH